ncbi:MAG: CDP-alcohol phosphatidyltransferase family protein [Candidatus Diapherotrites archaeon]|nr:CDP-alcohol phosphatidyltransferase family protein [Candidatus Diapherotrites archaeon]
MISKLRGKSHSAANVLAAPFIALGAPPLAVSLFAIPLAVIFAFFVAQRDFLLAFPFGLLAVLIDFVDGAVARRSNKSPVFGSYIDGVIDKVVDFILVGAFVFLFPFATVLALGCSFLASFAKPRVALVIITDNRDWPGIGERGDKLALLLAAVLVSAFLPTLFGAKTMEIGLLLVALISLVGFLQRIFYAKKLVAEAERKGTVLPYLKRKKR